ncbi:MAG: hypothetical protein ACRDTT_02280 [Pseudonocardiaceae bacterium]
MLHPAIEAASALPTRRLSGGPAQVLAAESELTPFCTEFGVVLPRLPTPALAADH